MSNLNKRIGELRADGKSWGEITKTINGEGWRTAKGNLFVKSYIQIYFSKKQTNATIAPSVSQEKLAPQGSEGRVNVSNEILRVIDFPVSAAKRIECIRVLLS